ncbi:MAG TPA: type II toxin-antitoxin system VapC family toxin [Candidatus Limnocylindrales bacterium]|nr:type II toxin-antitoxin system VapC family toxin [Candidatus Limnocylindrales bacterium]
MNGTPEKYTFDSEALLAFYFDEEGADVVEDILEQIGRGSAGGNINIINLAEIYYILSRKDPKIAEEKVKNIRLMGLKVVPVEDDGLWREAALLKSKYSMSLADAFAVATAKVFKTTLVIGSDREFDGVKVSLLRMRK